MKTIPTSNAQIEIAKLEPSRQALPFKILALFDAFFSDNGYEGIYKPRNSGPNYFVYYGRNKNVAGYKIEMEFYWDAINFTIYRPLTSWEKAGDVLNAVLSIGSMTVFTGTLFRAARVLDYSSDGRTNEKRDKLPREFTIQEAASIITPGSQLNNTFNEHTMELVLNDHKAFIEKYLMQSIMGEKWMGWW